MAVHHEVKEVALPRVLHADLWGLRQAKYEALSEADLAHTDWQELRPQSSPYYLFVPWDVQLLTEYEQGWKVTDAFPLNGVGMTTARDGFVIDHDRDKLLERVSAFRESTLGDDDLHQRFGIRRKKGWSIRRASQMLQDVPDGELDKMTVRVLYRPFDVRWICWHDAIVWRTVKQVMRHMLAGENATLCIGRAGQVVGPMTWNIIFVSRQIQDFNLFYRGGNVNFPLYLYPDPEGKTQKLFEELHWPAGKGGRVPNLSPDFVRELEAKLGMSFVSDGQGDGKKTFGPEDIFHYIYAVFHSPTYRERYAEFLKIDFPRVPLTSSKALFAQLASLGDKLVSLHLLEARELNNSGVGFNVPGTDEVEKVRYDEAHQRVYINKTQFFEPVPMEVWEFHVGGYQVCHKWLKDRKGRSLSFDDISHYRKIVKALKETITLMAEVDASIPGWPIE